MDFQKTIDRNNMWLVKPNGYGELRVCRVEDTILGRWYGKIEKDTYCVGPDFSIPSLNYDFDELFAGHWELKTCASVWKGIYLQFELVWKKIKLESED